ncbi:MAG: glycosyltransferase [Candidatus Woesearchaeota archaeon]
MDISIVIPAWNEEKNIGNILRDLRAQNVPKNGIEIIVADKDSKDNTAQIAQNYGAKIVSGGLPAVARNNGAKHATGDIIYFLDADLELNDNNFLNNSFNELNLKKFDAATADNFFYYTGTETLGQRILLEAFTKIGNWFTRYYANTSKPKATGTCIIIRKEIFDKIGGFNEESYWGEDTELVTKIVENKYTFGVLDTAKIYTSTRRPIEHGIIKNYLTVGLLAKHIEKHGNISLEDYRKLTGKKEYFKPRISEN